MSGAFLVIIRLANLQIIVWYCSLCLYLLNIIRWNRLVLPIRYCTIVIMAHSLMLVLQPILTFMFSIFLIRLVWKNKQPYKYDMCEIFLVCWLRESLFMLCNSKYNKLFDLQSFLSIPTAWYLWVHLLNTFFATSTPFLIFCVNLLREIAFFRIFLFGFRFFLYIFVADFIMYPLG